MATILTTSYPPTAVPSTTQLQKPLQTPNPFVRMAQNMIVMDFMLNTCMIMPLSGALLVLLYRLGGPFDVITLIQFLYAVVYFFLLIAALSTGLSVWQATKPGTPTSLVQNWIYVTSALFVFDFLLWFYYAIQFCVAFEYVLTTYHMLEQLILVTFNAMKVSFLNGIVMSMRIVAIYFVDKLRQENAILPGATATPMGVGDGTFNTPPQVPHTPAVPQMVNNPPQEVVHNKLEN